MKNNPLLIVMILVILALLAGPAYDFIDDCLDRETVYSQKKLDSYISPDQRERIMVWVEEERK